MVTLARYQFQASPGARAALQHTPCTIGGDKVVFKRRSERLAASIRVLPV